MQSAGGFGTFQVASPCGFTPINLTLNPMKDSLTRFACTLLVTAGLLAGCADEGAEPAVGTEADTMATADTMAMDGMAGTSTVVAVADLEGLADSGVSGSVTFTEEGGGVRIDVDVAGLTPGAHGFHVHENGDCGPGPDGTPGGAAGDHFAPLGNPHGAPEADSTQRHLGDLGNLDADDNGVAQDERTDEMLTLSGPNSIIGKALIIHSGEDDLTSQPSGNSGDRIACGVIQERSSM